MGKKITAVLLTVCFLLGITACSGEKAVSADESVSSSPQVYKLGISLPQKTAFTEEYLTQLQIQSQQTNIEIVSAYADNSADKQIADIDEMLAQEIQALAVWPVNVDGMTAALEQCDTEKKKVFNLIDPINGQVATLISADFIQMGRDLATLAQSALSGEEKSVLLVEGPSDSFLSQMLYDGFMETAAPAQWQVTSIRGNFTQEEAQKQAAKLFSQQDFQVVVTFNSAMAAGVQKAMAETEKQSKIVNLGADTEYVKQTAAGNFLGLVYVSPSEMAQKTLEIFLESQKGDSAAIPSYVGLSLKMLDQNSAAKQTDLDQMHAN